MSEPISRSFKTPAHAAGTTAWAWAVLGAAARHARTAPEVASGSFALGADGALESVGPGAGSAVLERQGDGTWTPARTPPADIRPLFDLYLPVCAAGPRVPVTIGHLGQSIDGYIATHSGDSSYVNGPENILHLHRMRALCDAVVVGATTIAHDDPRLTTRLAAGASPMRVVLDPRLRLKHDRRVFSDGEAQTLHVCAAELAVDADRIDGIEVVGIPCEAGRLDLAMLLEHLHARGLHSTFVEGGGTTVSRFLEAGLLDRLQIAIAPLVMGHGRPGLRLPANERITECLRPAHRVFAMGADILFDCDLSQSAGAKDGGRAALTRID